MEARAQKLKKTAKETAKNLFHHKSKHESLSQALFHIKNVSLGVEKVLEGSPLKTVLSAINSIIAFFEKIIEQKKKVASCIFVFTENLEMLLNILHGAGSEELPKYIDVFCQELVSVLQKELGTLKEMRDRNLLQRILHAGEHSEDIFYISERIEEAREIFNEKLAIGNARYSNRVLLEVEKLRLDKLDPGANAAFTEVYYDTCVEGTREDTLRRILDWSMDPSPGSSAIFWLNGMAGTGKSTIASTFSKQLYGEGQTETCRLGASFFCSSQVESRRMRKNVVPAIAYGLARYFSPFGQALLRHNKFSPPPPLDDQIKQLLISPWCESIKGYEGLSPFIVVIDALDELTGDDGLKFLDDLIRVATENKDSLRGLKFFVTSRRDPRIAELCSSLDKAGSICLEDVPSRTTEEDIKCYLEKSLPGLHKDLLSLVAVKACNLFIYAATAVRFIGPKTPLATQETRLQDILEAWPRPKSRYNWKKKDVLLDLMYNRILESWLSSDYVDPEHAAQVLQIVVYSLEPIPVLDIPSLCAPHEERIEADEATKIIESLHAVLHVREGMVYCYHESFIDFVKDPTRFSNRKLAKRICNPRREESLAVSCVTLLDSTFSNRQSTNSQIFQQHVEKPSAVGYALRNWDRHYVIAAASSETFLTKLAGIVRSPWPSIDEFNAVRKVVYWNQWRKNKNQPLLDSKSRIDDLYEAWNRKLKGTNKRLIGS